MVADNVTVTTRRAGEEQAWEWKSDGTSGFEITEAARESQGTTGCSRTQRRRRGVRVAVADRADRKKVLQPYRVSDLAPLREKRIRRQGQSEGRYSETEQINDAGALWKRSKSEITEEEYNEFYKTISHDTDDPLFSLHTQAEGTMEYTTLFYVPGRHRSICTRWTIDRG